MAELGVRLLLCGESRSLALYQVLAIAFTTTTFGYIERAMKEDWVIYDSFKKAQNVIMKFADTSPFPSFVLDSFGKIVKCNKRGKELLRSAVNKKKLRVDFADLLPPVSRDHFMDLSKRAITQGSHQTEAPLLVRPGSIHRGYLPCYRNLRAIPADHRGIGMEGD